MKNGIDALPVFRRITAAGQLAGEDVAGELVTTKPIEGRAEIEAVAFDQAKCVTAARPIKAGAPLFAAPRGMVSDKGSVALPWTATEGARAAGDVIEIT